MPVDRSITVSAPQSVDQRSLSTSSSIDELTAELPMLALIFTAKLRPMIIGSSSRWLMLAGMMARPRATSDAHELRIEALADRDELHLRRDLALARVVQLRHLPRPSARRDPGLAQLRQSLADVVAVRPARVVDAQRLAVGQHDLAHRHADARRAVDVHLAGARKRGREIRRRQRRVRRGGCS